MDKYEKTIETYNKVAKQFQNNFMDLDLYNDSFDKFCNIIEKQNADIFEIACGPGNITKYLLHQRPDFRIFGIDLSSSMIELAKENIANADFKLMDCRDISQIDERFDAIMCGFCLPYLTREEAAKLISDASELLNPNGLLYISTMEGDYNESGFETTSFSGQDEIYIHYHQADFLTDSLKKYGFNVVDIIRQDYPEPDGTLTTDMIILAQKE